MANRYRLVRLVTEEEFDAIRQVEEKLALISKYRNDLDNYALFRKTPRLGWTCWLDPEDLQSLIDGELDLEWDDGVWDGDES